jgi:hypothetical protein
MSNDVVVAFPRARIPMPDERRGRSRPMEGPGRGDLPVRPLARRRDARPELLPGRGLDPFKRPVHIVPVWNSSLGREVETVWPSINELETTAARTGAWAGIDPPDFGPLQTEPSRAAAR